MSSAKSSMNAPCCVVAFRVVSCDEPAPAARGWHQAFIWRERLSAVENRKKVPRVRGSVGPHEKHHKRLSP